MENGNAIGNGKEEIPLDSEVKELEALFSSQKTEQRSCWNRLHNRKNK